MSTAAQAKAEVKAAGEAKAQAAKAQAAKAKAAKEALGQFTRVQLQAAGLLERSKARMGVEVREAVRAAKVRGTLRL